MTNDSPPTWAPMHLAGFPQYYQLNDPAMDGDPGSGPNAGNNCGPETWAMILDYCHGISLDADYLYDVIERLRQRHGEPTGLGYTYVTDGERLLHFLSGGKTRPVTTWVDPSKPYSTTPGTPSAEILWTIWKALTYGHPLSALISWSAPNASDGHFIAIHGMSPTTIYTADPIKGPRQFSYEEFWSWSKGIVTEAKRGAFV